MSRFCSSFQIVEAWKKLDVGPSSKKEPRGKCPQKRGFGRWSWGYIEPQNKVDGRKALKVPNFKFKTKELLFRSRDVFRTLSNIYGEVLGNIVSDF